MLNTFPHTITIVTPSETTDPYGNTVLDFDTPASSVTVAAYVQPKGSGEATLDASREAQVRAFKCFTAASPMTGVERVTWGGVVYDVIGPSQRWDSPRGLHHYETALRVVEG